MEEFSRKRPAARWLWAMAFSGYISLGQAAKTFTGLRDIDPSSGNLKVSQINSCSTLDRIPWESKTNGKRTRQIFKDVLRKDGEKVFSDWELYQVLGADGEVSFVFQRTRQDGREEFIAAKGDTTERIMEIKKGRRRLIDKQNLKPLINRTAMSLLHKDGSRVEFIPGQTGKSTVVLFPTNDSGVGLAPVYLKGISCDKPESFSDDDINSRDLGAKGREGADKPVGLPGGKSASP